MPTRVCRAPWVFRSLTLRPTQPRGHGLFSVIFMRLRITEVDQDAVAHVLRDRSRLVAQSPRFDQGIFRISGCVGNVNYPAFNQCSP